MKPLFFFLFSILLMSACQSEIAIDKDKVIAVLGEYGKQNPENEVIISTQFGDINIRLYNETPLHRASFIRNIKLGYYTNRDFYRIVKGVCLQGGSKTDPQDFTIPAEFNPNLLHTRGALSMARYTENNPKKESSATEFFIITKGVYYNAEELAKYSPENRKKYLEKGGEMLFDNDYTTFGQVTKGIEIVEKLAKTNLSDIETPNRPLPFSIKVVSQQ